MDDRKRNERQEKDWTRVAKNCNENKREDEKEEE
jgi:hypothetical protein